VEIQPGLWWWQAVHPEWTEENSDWGPEVSSYAVDDGARLLLIDPSTPPTEVMDTAGGRDVIIVLTNWWHQRDAAALADRLGAQVFAPPPDDGREVGMATQQFQAGDRLPFGAEVFEGREPPLDVLLWIESHRAVAIGDTLIDRGNGIEIVDSWLADGVTREQVIDGLRPLLDLPVDVVLPTHGAPTDRAALERALGA
jgi:glyoxylase-like metal-dependent hydrolase (beta-lactamase superfamily II)